MRYLSILIKKRVTYGNLTPTEIKPTLKVWITGQWYGQGERIPLVPGTMPYSSGACITCVVTGEFRVSRAFRSHFLTFILDVRIFSKVLFYKLIILNNPWYNFSIVRYSARWRAIPFSHQWLAFRNTATTFGVTLEGPGTPNLTDVGTCNWKDNAQEPHLLCTLWQSTLTWNLTGAYLHCTISSLCMYCSTVHLASAQNYKNLQEIIKLLKHPEITVHLHGLCCHMISSNI